MRDFLAFKIQSGNVPKTLGYLTHSFVCTKLKSCRDCHHDHFNSRRTFPKIFVRVGLLIVVHIFIFGSAGSISSLCPELRLVEKVSLLDWYPDRNQLSSKICCSLLCTKIAINAPMRDHARRHDRPCNSLASSMDRFE